MDMMAAIDKFIYVYMTVDAWWLIFSVNFSKSSKYTIITLIWIILWGKILENKNGFKQL